MIAQLAQTTTTQAVPIITPPLATAIALLLLLESVWVGVVSRWSETARDWAGPNAGRHAAQLGLGACVWFRLVRSAHRLRGVPGKARCTRALFRSPEKVTHYQIHLALLTFAKMRSYFPSTTSHRQLRRT